MKKTVTEIEPDISIFVGSNNSGKTSAAHAVDIFINGKKDVLSIYDFTSYCWAEINKMGDDPQKSIQDEIELPCITLDLWFTIEDNDLHRVLDLLPEMSYKGKVLGARIQFQPKNSQETFKRYSEVKQKASQYAAEDANKSYAPWPKNLVDYLGKDLQDEYEFKYFPLDRSKFDDDFEQQAEYKPFSFPPDKGKSLVKSLVRIDILHAQRYLSDQAANGRSEDLSKCLSRFYKRNLQKREEDHTALSALFDSEVQFNDHLKNVFKETLEKLKELGYPGILNPHLVIRSALNPTLIMSQDTKVHYSLDGKDDSVTLPDNYSGLGFKNLIYMVVELLDIQARWVEEEENRALLQLIVIEEPEAHLHAQLQQVFIRQILNILKIEGQDAEYYSTQLILTTHSAQILFEKGFKPIRYFRREGDAGTGQHSTSLNVSRFYKDNPHSDFLERYMKLTHCDLFFADAAILVEGTVERILLPLMIEKCATDLQSSYASILEVGGAYAFRFKRLLEFLGIPALIVTDLDSVNQRKDEKVDEKVGKEIDEEVDEEDGEIGEFELEIENTSGETEGQPATVKYKIGKACMANTADAITSNQTLIQWLPKKTLIKELLAVEDTELLQEPGPATKTTVLVTYQREILVKLNKDEAKIAGRTLEEAFALENTVWCQDIKRSHLGLRFKRQPTTVLELAEKIHKRVKSTTFNKTSFALGVMAEDPKEWNVPTYIKQGLVWLAAQITPSAPPINPSMEKSILPYKTKV
ncbi:ATP-dependent endonuclease [Chitinophaga sancti]|uniref:AAA family ATPase n=1 Tax=Chitinophaga sancti TaxID=1004 RepID=UPI001C4303AB|nr:ATP-dependent endonuclease [Chitinophaga sancti]WQD63981.1 ATP-dependent endonuclease [Chitinophaga sancti]